MLVVIIIPQLSPIYLQELAYRVVLFMENLMSKGHGIDEDPVGITDFNSTITVACGLDPNKEHFAPNGRPFKIGGGGDPIYDVLT